MKVVRWPECDILESDLKLVNEFWYQTNVGPIIAGAIFPLSQLDNLKALKERIEAKKKELSLIEAEVYRISRDFVQG